MRVLIAGGGTGGHLYPAIAVLEALRAQDPGMELAYVGTRRGLEARVLPSTCPWVRFLPIHSRGLSRGSPAQNALAIALTLVGLAESLLVFAVFRPHVVLGMGGYASFPPVLLASLLGRILPIRTLVHEQNAIPGLANRLLSPWVDEVLVSYPQSADRFPRARRVVATGNPVRSEFLHSRRSKALYRQFGLDPRRRTVLVFGGSGGSAALTEAVLRAAAAIGREEGVQVLLAAGRGADVGDIAARIASAEAANVVVLPYIERMGEAFALADLVVSRAGASTLAEITSCGKASLLVPWDGAAEGHQWENALCLHEEKACAVAGDAEIREDGLARLIGQILNDGDALRRIAENARRLGRPHAAALILAEIVTQTREART